MNMEEHASKGRSCIFEAGSVREQFSRMSFLVDRQDEYPPTIGILSGSVSGSGKAPVLTNTGVRGKGSSSPEAQGLADVRLRSNGGGCRSS